jgi:hypothetical protein
MGRNPNFLSYSYFINQPDDLIGKKAMTIAQQLGVTKFPFIIRDENGNNIYWENSDGCWYKKEYDEREKLIYWETNLGVVSDKRPKAVPEYTMEELVDKMGHNFKIKK